MDARLGHEIYPADLVQAIAAMGADISRARRARGITQAEMALKLRVSRKTVAAMEKGDPKVAFGSFAMASWVLGLHKGFLEALGPDHDPELLRRAVLNVPERAHSNGDLKKMGDLDF